MLTRRFERELEKLRKEMELASSTGAPSSTASTSAPSTPYVDGGSEGGSVYEDGREDRVDGDGLADSPLVLPARGADVPELHLDSKKTE